MRGADLLPASPELIGLYIADLAPSSARPPSLSVSSIERRLSGLAWGYAQRGERMRRSEIVSLDHGKDDTPDSGGWVQLLDEGALITLRGKTGWREVEIARGSSEQTCPVHAMVQWLHCAKIDFGLIFVAVSRNGLKATQDRLSDKHVAQLIKQTVREAGIRPDLPEAERIKLYSGHSLRAGLASSAEVDER